MELRRARDAAQLKQADVAKAMEWSPSKLIRIEAGQVSISANDLRALLAHYNVKEKRRVDALLDLARSSRGQSWFDRFDDVLNPGFREYLSYEASATTIRQFEPLLVPGFLQIEDYARAQIKVYGIGDDDIDKLWAVREQRQEIHERSDPPEIQVILDEAVLRHQIGGPKVMQRQLERLRWFADQPHVAVLVLPFSVGAHQGMAGPFVVLSFDDPSLDDIVHLESAGDTTIRDDPNATARYLDRFAVLEELAASPEASIAFIDDAIRQLSAPSNSEPIKEAI